MRAYYYDNLPGDQRLPHDYVPTRPVAQNTLQRLNVESWSIQDENLESQIDALMNKRGYKSHDVVNVSKEGLGEPQRYEQQMEIFFREHMHEDQEIRFILDGSGFFDIRESPSDAWIRLAVSSGDILVVPAGIYHRFTLDEKERIKTARLFEEVPKWVACNRGEETDKNPCRVNYLKSIGILT